MDPTEAELNAITTLGDVADWAGTTGGLHDTLVASLGTPTKLRDIAFISRQSWDRVVNGLQLVVTPATDTTAAVTRPLNPTEKGVFETPWHHTRCSRWYRPTYGYGCGTSGSWRSSSDRNIGGSFSYQKAQAEQRP